MFHIVFQPRGVEVLTAAMDMDEALDGEILLIKDDYSVGPIVPLSPDEGIALRKAWWQKITGSKKPEEQAGTASVSGDQENLQQILNRMREEQFDQIWIWVAPNAQDSSGYYWLISRLNEFAGRIYVLFLNNLPFINDKGAVFYPVFLSEIPPREFVKARKLARLVTSAEWETDPDEWLKLGSENKHIRILEGARKLIQQDDDYFDKLLKKSMGTDLQKPSRIVNHFLSRSPVRTGEAFLLWRLQQLAVSGEIEQQGEWLRIPPAISGEIAQDE